MFHKFLTAVHGPEVPGAFAIRVVMSCFGQCARFSSPDRIVELSLRAIQQPRSNPGCFALPPNWSRQHNFGLWSVLPLGIGWLLHGRSKTLSQFGSCRPPLYPA